LGLSFFAGASGTGAPGGGSSGVCAVALAVTISQQLRIAENIEMGRRSFISGVIPARL
jgi:hypothetical protein